MSKDIERVGVERVFVVAVYFIETDGRPGDREAAEGIR
jgi:hypothetical protein